MTFASFSAIPSNMAEPTHSKVRTPIRLFQEDPAIEARNAVGTFPPSRAMEFGMMWGQEDKRNAEDARDAMPNVDDLHDL
jgi:hypothetical protein